MCSTDIFLGLLAVLFPPLPVWVKRGICSADSIINILLLILGYVPGLLHSWYIIASYPEPEYEYDYQPVPRGDAEQGRIYVFVHNNGHHHAQPQGYQGYHPHPPQQQGVQPAQGPAGMNYGTTSQGGGAASAPPPQQQEHGEAGPSDGGPPPPSYAQVVAGDHKVQMQD